MDAINLVITVCAVLVADQLRGKESGVCLDTSRCSNA